MKVRFLGQNCFLIHYKGKNILTDPFYAYQADKSGFSVSDQKIDYILITHAHEDHTADVKAVLEAHPEVTLIGQPEICGHFNHPHSIDLNIGGTAKIEDMKVTMVQAMHTSSFPDGSYGGHPSGYMLRTPEKTVYLSGDTSVMSDMKLFAALYGPVHTAILPVGGHYTMCMHKAAFAASSLLECKSVVGCHFDTFPPIEISHEEAYKTFEKAGVELRLPKAGEEFEI